MEPSLDLLRLKLRKLGLPVSYVSRFCREIADHLEDEGAQKPIVYAESLAQVCVREYRRSHWEGRHPVAGWCYGASLPLLSTIVMFLSVGLILEPIPEESVPKQILIYLPEIISVLIVVIVGISWSLAVERMRVTINRMGRGNAWMSLALALQCSIVSTFTMGLGEDGMNCEFLCSELPTLSNAIKNSLFMLLVFVWLELRDQSRCQLTEQNGPETLPNR